ncbi:nitroreductase family protein [Enterococcus cecorum]|uniref:Nitroreductase n=1 Tax=Enterococcus cecorum DSM 20682 = ATCC 43198 TaxID=1121864 RepID=S1RI57_9ENTE|nr:nitroreductase family protein [Enterococcus cecorum]EOX17595.1 nitroreductase [Enterococcus cecorum DSM 20682 = ATCC 43198]ESK60383.1 nitroreductase [Enterococcus cecorum DSM 20682 = ATCC 43198]OJG33415.1 nitroreductase [Enterococcus cecorum DSM 20682 = ATCC 43198]CAI3391056.1 nitroreductase family protein [Enterococcus cecorum DSM 20682 = ATCC 43198]SQE54358.1 MarR family transcriptional regulator [Enterococcus cecorum]
MSQVHNNDFQDIVLNRRSIRNYDPSYEIEHSELLQIIDEAAKAPSSVNLQPWRFVIVESEEAKAKLKPLIRFNTLQNETSSAMILIFGDLKCQEYAQEIYQEAVNRGLMPQEVMEKQLAAIVPMYDSLNKAQMERIVQIDASLVAMQLMLVARSHGYDTNPIGGIDADQLAAAFDLDEERFHPVMILSIGKAMETGYESVRLSAEKITVFK